MNCTKNHHHRLSAIVIIILGVLLLCPVRVSGLAEFPQGHSVELVVTGTSFNGSTIRILTANPCIPIVRYANFSWFSRFSAYDHTIIAPSSCTTHVVPFSGLEPGTVYYYQASGCGTDEITGSFSTFPVHGTCRFVVYGDTREQSPLYTQTERHRIVADRIAEETESLFTINLGDIVTDSDDSAEWARFFNATDKLRSRTTYIVIPGNHDEDRALFSSLFGMTGPGYFDCGDTRVLLLDSTDYSSLNLREQAALVTSAFRSFPGTRIAALHHPPYSSDEKHFGGWENLQRDLVPAFRNNSVTLVFSAHVHAYERVDRDDISYITEARGGAPAYPLKSPGISGSQEVIENTLGYSRIVSEEGMVTLQAITVAETSRDLMNISRTYDPGTAGFSIRIPVHRQGKSYPEFDTLAQKAKAVQQCIKKKMLPSIKN